MAGNSPPRRSSRARTVQSQSQSQAQSQQSSTSSSLSGRPERNTRLVNKTGSPQKSTPSLSDEPPDESVASTDDLPTRRRRTRAQGQEEERDKPLPHRDTIEMAGDPDELLEEDDGAVRCVCGFDDYPGPPPVDDDKKHGPKDSIDVEPLLPSDINDDVAGLFVQCDVCNVWQHGACVGIMSEDTTPDEYYCEECRKDLHKVHIASNGQRYSHYFPILPNHRKSTTRSRSPKDKDSKERETRSGRQSSITQASKRRSTMNSRDAAYDEEEQIRLAIEASSKEVVGQDNAIENASGSRRSKRGRDDSEEKQDNGKRQRTKSKSPSPAEDNNEQPDTLEDSEEALTNRSGSKKSRNLVTRNQGQHKEKEREERERQRAEAAKKRSGRAERRRADGSTPASTILVKGLEAQVDTDSDPSEELPLATRTVASRSAGEKAAATATATATTTGPSESKVETTSTVEAPPSSQPTPDTPPTHTPAQNSSKPKRAPPKKGKGRNQYTKDRDIRDETSPARSQSRDVQGHDTGHAHHSKSGEASHKPHSRAKGGFNSKVSMTDMKRKASAMLDYISRTQIEMAGEATPPNTHSPKPVEGVAPQTAGSAARPGQKKASELANGESGSSSHPMGTQRDFKDLSSMEMMARLSTDLIKWQQEFAS